MAVYLVFFHMKGRKLCQVSPSTPGYMVLRKHSLLGSKAFEIIPVSYDHSFQRAALRALGAPLFTIQG